MKKMTLREKILTGISIVLLLGVTLLIIINQSERIVATPPLVMLGDDAKIELVESGASCTALSFDGSCLPNDSYKQNISIKLPINVPNSFVRVKFYIPNSEGQNVYLNVDTMTNWVKSSDDNYYYYQAPFMSGTSASLTNKIILPSREKLQMRSNITYNIMVEVETLNINDNVHNLLWSSAPDFVLQIYDNQIV